MEPGEKGASSTRRTRFRITVPKPAVAEEGSPPTEPRPLTEPVPGVEPAVGRVFTVYSISAEEAERAVRVELGLAAEVPLTVEEAGHVEDGRVHFPPEEDAAIKASIQEGPTKGRGGHAG